MENTEKPEAIEIFFNEHADDYDIVHPSMISGGMESKSRFASYLPEGVSNLLDLGCGTGLELTGVFERFPTAKVVGVDMAERMLDKLKSKFSDRNVTCIVGNYLDYQITQSAFDCIFSVMSLHHLSKMQKKRLYKKVYDALPEGCAFLNCDYIVDDIETELKEEQAVTALTDGLPADTIYHLDKPTCLETEISLLYEAGFACVEVVYNTGNTKTLRCSKHTLPNSKAILLNLADSNAFEIEVFDSLSSTNTYIKERALAGAREGLAVFAQTQTEGRGCGEHTFFSPEGGLYLSYLMRESVPQTDFTKLTTTAAVAVAKTLEDYSKHPTIKYINDILIDGKKVCGILCESVLDTEYKPRFVIVGIGLNLFPPVNGFPEELENIASSIFLPDEVNVNRFAADLLQNLANVLSAK